ncbi:MAG: PA14 domain-containing protein [Akkermansiaceae bacterium]
MKLIIYRQFLIHALDFVVVLKKACKPRGIYFITMTSSMAKKTTFLRLLAVSLTLAATPCDAEDGKALYTTYCSACHGIDGKGANNGAFPPLAKSPWVSGEPSRVIQIVLHGLQGEITVPTDKDPNKKYNLVMPPQGGTLTDEQIVPILNYVRNSWGNKNEPVKLNDVVKNRRVTGARTTMWQADELLKKYPIASLQPPPIKGLVSKVYHGSWKTRPDFSKLEAVATHEEHKGLISLANANKPENFGMVWEGELPVSRDGTYTFTLDSDDGSALYIDGELVTEVKGLGAMGRAKAGKVKLAKGLHDIRVEYFELSGQEAITLAMQGPGIKSPLQLSAAKPNIKKGPKWPSIPIDPPKGGTAFYRGFIAGSTPRAIGVGYDGGINLAFSADNLAVELLWQERFYDGGRHWTARGQGNEPPAGTQIVKLTSQPAWGILESPTAPWQPANEDNIKRRFRGYQLGENDRPTFNYEVGLLKVSDLPNPDFSSKGITRTLSIDVPASGAPENLHLLICNGLEIKAADSANTYRLGNNMQVEISSNSSALVRSKELILPLNLKPGNNLITLRYQWK